MFETLNVDTCNLFADIIVTVSFYLPFTELAPVMVFSKNGLSIEFRFDRVAGSSITSIHLQARNSNPSPLENFVFQAAVPKTIQLQLSSPSGSVIPPNNSGALTQEIKINNAMKVSFVLCCSFVFHFCLSYDHAINVVERERDVAV